MQRLKALARRSRAVVDRTEEEIEQTTAGRMPADYHHLNALMDET